MDMKMLYWTDRNSFPLEEELEPLFEAALARGYRPYREVYDGSIASQAFGILAASRQAFFIRRGRGLEGMRGTLWEVLLCEAETTNRLGHYFGLPEHSCVVVCGIEAVSSINECWLQGGDITLVINSAKFFDRRNMVALKPPDTSIAK